MSTDPEEQGLVRASDDSSSGLALAFDTATDAIALALVEIDGTSVALRISSDFEARRAALSRLLPAIQELLDSQSVSVSELTRIVVGHGPGSFTGVRIGVATAKGLAHGLGAPLHGVGTLDAIAWRLRGHEGLVGVVGDAMRGEVYPALFRASSGLVERLTPDRVMLPQQAAEEFSGVAEPILLSGNGIVKYRSVFEDALGSQVTVAEESMWAPSGAGLADAYRTALSLGTLSSGAPGELLPVYTRLSDAEENERVDAGLPARPSPSSGVAGPEVGDAG